MGTEVKIPHIEMRIRQGISFIAGLFTGGEKPAEQAAIQSSEDNKLEDAGIKKKDKNSKELGTSIDEDKLVEDVAKVTDATTKALPAM